MKWRGNTFAADARESVILRADVANVLKQANKKGSSIILPGSFGIFKSQLNAFQQRQKTAERFYWWKGEGRRLACVS